MTMSGQLSHVNNYMMNTMDTTSWMCHIKREFGQLDYFMANNGRNNYCQSAPVPIYPTIRIKQEPDTGYGSLTNSSLHDWGLNETNRSTAGFSLTHIQNLALKECAKEIDIACDALNISADPFNWNVTDVRSWLEWTQRQFNLLDFPLEYFQMDGMNLCKLSEQDFKDRAPLCGETLYAQLEIWKTAVDFRPEESILEFSSILSNWSSSPPPYCTSPPSTISAVPSPGQESIGTDAHTVCVSPVSPPMCSSPVSLITGNTTTGVGSPLFGSSIESSSIVTSDYGSEGTQSDDDISDDGCDLSLSGHLEQSPPTSSTTTVGRSGSGSHIHLWQFLKELLSQPQMYGSCIRWMDRPKGVFKIEDSVRVAKLWGKRKNRPAMNYDKLSRSIRQYYKKGIMKKTERSQRLVYQFCHPYCL
ncbi:DNA-binding protein D-ETS-4-like [Oppia nitens]|uniref:DNA-binding protein D-ETS-4-like n=1 Tax=Oppia nitens TaxID=1686743 RepID=UPI0023DC9440|nr:DNA-binding protein D-ETS-4-like [Oppia nitens]